MTPSRAQLRAVHTKRRARLARQRRVNAALGRWDEIDAAAEMPEDLRPPLVEQPTVGWAALKELQGMLGEMLGELGAPTRPRREQLAPG